MMVLEKNVRCTCGATFTIGDRCVEARGRLINHIASLGSRLVTVKANIIELSNRCKRQVGRKTAEHIKRQREIDEARLQVLQQELPWLEGTFFGLRFLEREMDRG